MAVCDKPRFNSYAFALAAESAVRETLLSSQAYLLQEPSTLHSSEDEVGEMCKDQQKVRRFLESRCRQMRDLQRFSVPTP